MSDGSAAAVVIGVLAAGAGILAVDHALSKPGASMVDKIVAKLSGKEEAEQAGPALPAREAAPPQLPARTQPPTRAQARPSIRTQPVPGPRTIPPRVPSRPPPPARMPPRMPIEITPDVVRQVAARLGLQPSAIITPQMQQVIRQLQAQLGLPETGFPDGRLLQQLGVPLGPRARRAAPPMQSAAPPAPPRTVTSEAAKVISKTFGGPPSTPRTPPDEGLRKTQQMLNAYFKGHVIEEDGITGPHTTGAITEFQKAEGLAETGRMDDKTHDLLVKRTSGDSSWLSDVGDWFGRQLHRTGADDDAWKAETQELGQQAQDIISRAINTEMNQGTLKGLNKLLNDAGYPKAATAVLAAKPVPKKPAGKTAASGSIGYFPDPYFGRYPAMFGPWWLQPHPIAGW